MSRRKLGVPSRSPRKIPKDIAALLGEPALMRGENRDEYDDMLLAIAESVGADNIVAWLSADDVTFHTWDGRRLQKIRVKILLERQIEIVEELLKSTYDDHKKYPEPLYAVFDASNDARRWATDTVFGAELDERLKSRGYDRDTIVAKAYARCASQLAVIEKSIADKGTAPNGDAF